MSSPPITFRPENFIDCSVKPSRFSAFSSKVSRVAQQVPILIELPSRSPSIRNVTDASIPSSEFSQSEDSCCASASITPISASRIGILSLHQWNASQSQMITPVPRTCSVPLESHLINEERFQSLHTPEVVEEFFERSGAQSPKPLCRG